MKFCTINLSKGYWILQFHSENALLVWAIQTSTDSYTLKSVHVYIYDIRAQGGFHLSLL